MAGEGDSVTKPVWVIHTDGSTQQGTATNPLVTEDVTVSALDSANTTTTPLASDAKFTGAWTSWGQHIGLQISVVTDVVGGLNDDGVRALVIEFSSDGGSTIDRKLGIDVEAEDATGGGIEAFVPREATDYRVTYQNGSTGQATFRLTTTRLADAPTQKLVPLEDSLSSRSEAHLVVGVLRGRQPDGNYVAVRASGVAFSTEDQLSAAEQFVSEWVDTDGWGTVTIFVSSDVVSASDGLLLEFTDDVQAATPTVRGTRAFEFTSQDVSNGFLLLRLPSALDGFRIKYKNGGTATSSFYLSATLRVEPENPQNTLTSDINDTSPTVMVRGAVFAKNDAGQYALINRSDLGGLRASVIEHEAETPIEALDRLVINTATVGTTAVRINASPQSNRRSIEIHASPANTKDVAIGKTSAVTATSGRRLDPGSSVVWELSDDYNGELWAISTGSGQGLAITEIGDSDPPV